ncbi:MAG: 3-hydroxyacyl-CoA dehydrogenase NAD-binding domain-containing protein, partial [Bacillota bacterium]|nr:3-hydroxyacyl-CoA dehydrogenase NAD-binding domain-containing protein [Bacillota bacterium]
MKRQPAIKRVAILGAGVMGAQIAARLADAGIPCDLLDLVVDETDPNKLALGALKRLQEMKPAPFYDPQALYLIRPGNLEDHLHRLQEADWVLEAIIEDLEAKHQLWQKVLPHIAPGALLSTNTSGLPIARIAEVFSPEDRKRFMGTHFFNPVRYMKLLEIIPLPETSPELVERVVQLGQGRLGKGIVVAKDAPNFIANRIGTFAFQVAVQEMMKRSLSVEAMDVITGPALGHPKSATFRTLDLVGIDTYLHVADNLRQQAQDEEDREAFAVPDFLRRLVQEGALGEKSGRGVYRRTKGAQGETVIEALDWSSYTYKPQEKPRFASVGAALKASDPVERVKIFLSGEDEAAAAARAITYRVLGYAARRAREIAPSIQAVDDAMRWGFNWDIGPFQLWDGLGFKETLQALEESGEALPDWIRQVEEKGGFYDGSGQPTLAPWADLPGMEAMPAAPYPVAHYLREKKIWRTEDATLVDLGEEVVGLILHGAKDALGPGTFEALSRAIDEVEASWRGLVVTGAGENFSVGANLLLVLMAVQSNAV